MKIECYKRIIEAMRIRNIKQVDLCEKTGINKSTISQYVSGKYEPSQDRLEKIADALNVDAVWLMGYDVDMEKKNYDIKNNMFEEIGQEGINILQKRLKERRNSLGLTLQQVAEKLNVKEDIIYKYECGEKKDIKHEIVAKLAEIYNCSPAYLMGWENTIIVQNEIDSEIANNLKKLSAENIKDVNNYISYLLEKQKKEKK